MNNDTKHKLRVLTGLRLQRQKYCEKLAEVELFQSHYTQIDYMRKVMGLNRLIDRIDQTIVEMESE